MNLSLSYYSGLGKRKNNEDAVSVLESVNGVLAVVADGLGGQENGELASREAVKTLIDRLSGESISPRKLTDAILEANERICALHADHPGAQTTIAAVWLGDGFAEAIHVGDTRIYQFRGDSILYQSADHSIAQLGVLAGDIKPGEVRTNRDRNKLFRVLGDKRVPKIAEKLLDIQPGDRLLLCSDGFWEGILEADMLRCARLTDNAEQWLRKMREIAEPVASDNNTAIAIVIRE
ncbi:MAG: serine/threonine-protein phosphatase [Eubacteriales bacterium]|nr:serine/threonine-protein phosphatase [Eubacteriales bacterium]